MISIVMTKKEATDSMGCMPCDPADGPRYPYGTSLTLDNDTLLKLGLSEMPPAGTEFALIAVVKVTGSRINERQDGTDSSLDLQITDMELNTVGKTDEQRAAKLYNKK